MKKNRQDLHCGQRCPEGLLKYRAARAKGKEKAVKAAKLQAEIAKLRENAAKVTATTGHDALLLEIAKARLRAQAAQAKQTG